MSAEDALALKEAGNALMKKEDWKGALEKYTKAIEIDPSNHLFYSNRCIAQIRLGEPESALKDAEKCIELAPEWSRGFARKAHALKELKRYEESVKACEEGLALPKPDKTLLVVRKEAKTQALLEQLIGTWNGTVPQELGGYDQELIFKSGDEVIVNVFEKSVVTKMRLNGEPSPAHLDLWVPDSPQGSHDISYIVKVEDGILHLCSPNFEAPNERPKVFAGPSYVQLKRGPKAKVVDDETRAWVESLTDEQKQEEYITAALKIFPGRRLLPLQTDSEAAQNEITLLNIRFQSENYKITAKFGEATEQVVREYLLGERLPQGEKMPALVQKLKLKMQEAHLLPGDEDMDNFRKHQREMEAQQQKPSSSKAPTTSPTSTENKSTPPGPKTTAPSQPKPQTSAKKEPAQEAKKEPAKTEVVGSDTDETLASLIGLAVVVAGIAIIGAFLLRKK